MVYIKSVKNLKMTLLNTNIIIPIHFNRLYFYRLHGQLVYIKLVEYSKMTLLNINIIIPNKSQNNIALWSVIAW